VMTYEMDSSLGAILLGGDIRVAQQTMEDRFSSGENGSRSMM